MKISKFFEHTPVRKQNAIKNSTKVLSKIRRLVKAYALARPNIRLHLRILKAPTNKGDFTYAPTLNSNIKDAVIKVISKDCALECDLTTINDEGFAIQAVLPRVSADVSKISYHGTFISIDGRPVSHSRGTIRSIVGVFKERLQKTSPTPIFGNDSFLCMNITCPLGSYDPNIEPAKDDVLFEDSDVVLRLVQKLLASHYPDLDKQVDISRPVVSPQQPQDNFASHETVDMSHIVPSAEGEEIASSMAQDGPRWRSTMYGIDEEDLELMKEEGPSVLIHDEEGSRAIDVSNPWTIARMNAPTRPKVSMRNGQLPSPTKSQGHMSLLSSSPDRNFPRVCNPGDRSTTPYSSYAEEIYKEKDNESLKGSVHNLGLRKSREEHTTPRTKNSLHDNGNASGRLSDENEKKVPDSNIPSTSHVDKTLLPQFQVQVMQQLEGSDREKGSKNRNYVPPFNAFDNIWHTRLVQASTSAPRAKQMMSSSSRDVSVSEHDGILLPSDKLSSRNHTDIRKFFDTSSSTNRRSQQKSTTYQSNSVRGLKQRSPPLVQHRGDIRRYQNMQRASSVGIRTPSLFHIDSDITKTTEGLRGGKPEFPKQMEFYRSGNIQPPQPASISVSHISPRPNGLSAPTVSAPRHTRNMQKTQEMEDYFQVVENSELRYASRGLVPTQKTRLRECSSQETLSIIDQTVQSNAADPIHESSPSIQMDRASIGFHAHNLVLLLDIDVSDILRNFQSFKIDADVERCDSWLEEAGHAFCQAISHQVILRWAIKLDGFLDEIHEKEEGTDAQGALQESLQKAIEWNRENEQSQSCRLPSVRARQESSTTGTAMENSNDLATVAFTDHAEFGLGLLEPEMQDSSTSQSMHMRGEKQAQTTLEAQEMAPTDLMEDEYDEKLDDEMLMDL